MVLSRFPDPEYLEATYKVKLKRPLMESGSDRRVRVASTKDSRTTATTTTTTTTLEGFRGNVVAGSELRNLQSTALPATRQKVRRRPLDEDPGWRDCCVLSGQKRRVVRCTVGGERLAKKCTSGGSNGGIVPARCELARNNCATLLTAAAAEKRPAILAERLRLKEDGSRSIVAGKSARNLLFVDEQDDEDEEEERSDILARRKSTARRLLAKSVSVPENLKEVSRGKSPLRVAEDGGGGGGGGGILKRSSAFLASLSHSAAGRESERKSRAGKSAHVDGYVPDYAKGYFPVLTNGVAEDDRLLRSPSLQTLPTSWKKKSSGASVKKSVSFSSDTSFEEKRTAARKSTVHEVKIYRKGVLQGRDTREKIITKVPPSWETPSGGPAALLRAAREADDATLKEIVTRARKMGLGNMDINMVDSSGRSAVSYMAGNGAASMLEAALAFDGVDPNLPDNEGNTPLHFAAQAGQTECLNILLERCPDIEVDARNSLGFTPLMKAALQGRTKCAKILLFAGANPTLRDHGRGLRAEQWARFCGRYVCAEVIERFARHRLLERTTSCRWGSEPELAAKVLQGKVIPIPTTPAPPASSGLKSRIRRVFRTTSGPERTFSLVSQLTSAALCVSSPALPKPGDVPPLVKSLLRPLNVPQLRVTLVAPHDIVEKTADKYGTSFSEKIEHAMTKPPRTKKKSK